MSKFENFEKTFANKKLILSKQTNKNELKFLIFLDNKKIRNFEIFFESIKKKKLIIYILKNYQCYFQIAKILEIILLNKGKLNNFLEVCSTKYSFKTKYKNIKQN